MARWIATWVILFTGSFLLLNCNLLADEKGTAGSVAFLFDGGTLQCTFGKSNRDEVSHVAMIVFPASFERFSNRMETPIDETQDGSVVLVLDANGKFVQLTDESLRAWSKGRISDMAGREASVAENAFIATVVHTISTGMPIQTWASKAEKMLESGRWNKLFDPPSQEGDPVDLDPFGN